MAGKPERLGGSPRTNADDAYATFMDMNDEEWSSVVFSLLAGGALQPEERKGFERALAERGRRG